MLSKLTAQQRDIVLADGSLLVTACPGSGKTRVLTSKIFHTLHNLSYHKRKVIALTYTNRAAEEIISRIDRLDVATEDLWVGTIHSFCIEWILKPYGAYSERLRNGYRIIDEHKADIIMADIKQAYNLKYYDEVNTKYSPKGTLKNADDRSIKAANQYHEYLVVQNLLDFDLIIFQAFQLLKAKPKIAKVLANLFEVICVDEYQDTQELQYLILSEIVKEGGHNTKFFLVGDPDQAIYQGLGAQAKSKEELEVYFGCNIKQAEIDGCFRSSQKIIDFYRNFQVTNLNISALGANASNVGEISYDRAVHKNDLPECVISIISDRIKAGVALEDICIVAPQWNLVLPFAKKLKKLMPELILDAPGLSLLRKNKDNIFYKIARLFLTEATSRLYTTRIRWSKEIISELVDIHNVHLSHDVTPKILLKITNTYQSNDSDGLVFLKGAISNFISSLAINVKSHDSLQAQYDSFFEGALHRYSDENIPKDTDSMRGVFKEKSGIVVNTCHGLKGEEFDTVVGFGLLHGFIPHWNDIYKDQSTSIISSKKLLYVLASRAKNNLYLFSETGRMTKGNKPYLPNEQLKAVSWSYD